MPEPVPYTHAEWRVKPGRESEFVAAWRALADAFAALDRPPLWGTLLQSESEPRVFYSFGPWRSAADVAAMRSDPEAQAAIGRVVDLCESAAPGPCLLVAHVEVREPGPRPG